MAGGGATLSNWLNREIRLSRWINENNYETQFADGLLFAEILARFGVRHQQKTPDAI